MSRQTPTAIVRLAEAAIRRAHSSTTQEVLAEQVGLLSHSGINTRLTNVNSGKIDSLLETYNGKQLISLLAHNDAFAADLLAALADDTAAGQSATAVGSLRALGKRLNAEVGEIIDDLDDNDLSVTEADNHLEALDLIAADLTKARADLLHRKTNNRSRP